MNLKGIYVNKTRKRVNINKYLIIKEARVSEDYGNFCGEDIWTKRIYSAFKKLYSITHIDDFEQIFQIELDGADWDTVEKYVLRNFPNVIKRCTIDNE